MKLLIATSNPGKEQQFRYIFKDKPQINLLFLRDVNLAGIAVTEDGKTAKENALKKAKFFMEKSGLATLADDAGVEIDALGAEPGLKARRWGGHFSDTVDDETWLQFLLKKMKDVPQQNRGGRVRASWAVYFPDGKTLDLELIRPFYLLKIPQRPYIKGMPISALDFDISRNKLVKDMTEEELYTDVKEYLDGWEELWQAIKDK